MEMNFKKKITVLGSICLLLVGLIIGLSYLQKPKSFQKGAFGTSSLELLTELPPNKAINQPFWIEAKIITSEKVTMFDLIIDYDKDKLQIVDGSQQTGTTFQLNNFTIDTTNGKIIVGGTDKQVLGGSGAINPALFATGSVLLVKFQAKGLVAVAAPGTKVEFIDPMVVYGYNPGQTDTVITIGAKTFLNLTFVAGGGVTPTATPIPACNTAPTGTNEVKICASPKDRTVLGKNNEPINSPVQEIWFNSGSKAVKYVKLILSFSHDKININGATFANNFDGTYRVSPLNADHIILEATNSGTLTGRKKIAELSMSVHGDKPNNGVTYVNLCGLPNANYPCQTSTGTNLPYESEINGTSGSDADSYNLVIDSPDGIANKLLTVHFTSYGTVVPTPTVTPGGATNTPTPTVTPDPSQTATVNFKVKFQGISQKRADQKVKVRVIKGTFEKEFTDINVVADDSGIYSGSVVLTGVTVGEDYTIFVKGPKHLAKKFCSDAQTSRCREVGDITLVAGANTFDFSKMALEAGDLPNPNDGNRQDGVCNSVDYSLAKNRLGSSSAADLAIADVNLDGVVNTIDSTLIRNTLEVKYEEDY